MEKDVPLFLPVCDYECTIAEYLIEDWPDIPQPCKECELLHN